MRILLVANKTLSRNELERIDQTYWNFYLPLIELGHEVFFYDTVNPTEKNFQKIVDVFKPNLVFSILTGNQFVTPYEPIKEIKQLTRSGTVKTFNWFCDDTWRYETFSKNICRFFFACSTPERKYVNQYKQDGYQNILVGNWHVNPDVITRSSTKEFDVGFIGGLNSKRIASLQNLASLGFRMGNNSGMSHEDMYLLYSSSKIGLNLSVNENDPEKKTQMKLRIFEIPATQTMLLTEYHSGIEEYYKPNEEIVCFTSDGDMLEKLRFYLKSDSAREQIALAGYNKTIAEHTSKSRLDKLIKEIEAL